MRKFSVIKKTKCDVAVIDRSGDEWLKYCIPENLSVSSIDIHNSLPIVASFSFAYNVIRIIKQNGINGVSLLSVVISELQPKVVLTLSDNNSFMGELQSAFPDILFISVQIL